MIERWIVLEMSAKVDSLKKTAENKWRNHTNEIRHYGECLGIGKQIF